MNRHWKALFSSSSLMPKLTNPGKYFRESVEGLLFFHSSLSVSPWTTDGCLGKALEDTLENILCISALEVLHLALGVQQTGRNEQEWYIFHFCDFPSGIHTSEKRTMRAMRSKKGQKAWFEEVSNMVSQNLFVSEAVETNTAACDCCNSRHTHDS